MEELGEKPFRGRQLFEWIHKKQVKSYEEMTDLPRLLRESMEKTRPIRTVRCVKELVSKKDGTRKYLFALHDENVIESVFMRYKHGNTACISSQVGCNMGCTFCASTLEGCVRDLTASEMLAQIYEMQRLTGERLSNVVVMGSGEPLDNYVNLTRFIRLITDPGGQGMSGRNLTVSTCGLVPGIRQLALEGFTLTLALSLHGATDEKRRRIMPVAKVWSISELMEACRFYHEHTQRRITFEYALVKGVNDSLEDARDLAHLASDLGAHINLIPVNPVEETGARRPSRAALEEFRSELERRGANATVRRELGPDINAACGQLRRGVSRGSEQ